MDERYKSFTRDELIAELNAWEEKEKTLAEDRFELEEYASTLDRKARRLGDPWHWYLYNVVKWTIIGLVFANLMIWSVKADQANAQVTVSASVPCTLQNYQHSNCLTEELLQEEVTQCIWKQSF